MVSRNGGRGGKLSAMRGSGGSFSDMRGGGGCVCMWGWEGMWWWYGVVLVCGVQLVLCVGGGCGGAVVGDGTVLPMQLVCVGKPACSHICCLGVVGIDDSVIEHFPFGPSCLVSLLI